MKLLHQAAKFAAASKDDNKNFYLACIGLRRDGVLVYATNTIVAEHPTPSAHAEARVLRKTGKGAILWVARVLRDGKTWALAKPCITCTPLIENKDVERVYYTIGPNEWGVWIPG